jgi:hypothetical protein
MNNAMFDPVMKNGLGNYKSFLESFIRAQYEFVFFDEIDKLDYQIVLRHDIDFDTRIALEAARTEADLGVKSTYFFFIRSHFYNPFSLEDFNHIQEIKRLGHAISLHFDTALYDDVEAGLATEMKMFESLFGVKVNIISLHRPSDFYLNYDAPILNVQHTYQSQYFRNLKYFSDSTGIWRYGDPLNAEAFKMRQSIHLLIHPIWWFIDEPTNYEKLKVLFRAKTGFLKQEFAKHCRLFSDIYHEL